MFKVFPLRNEPLKRRAKTPASVSELSHDRRECLKARTSKGGFYIGVFHPDIVHTERLYYIITVYIHRAGQEARQCLNAKYI